MNNLFKKYISWAVLFFVINLVFPVSVVVALSLPGVGGGGLGDIDPFKELLIPGHHLTKALMRAIMEDMTDEMGIDKDVFRRGARKTTAPTVSITFDITNPKEGEKVTAMAIPQGFVTSLDKLYYTWYIIHTDKDGKVKGDINKAIEDGKKEAMGWVARGSFDPTLQGIEYEGEDDDNDGFLASIGGKDGVGAKEATSGDCDGGECPWGDPEGCIRCFDDQGEALEEWKADDGILAKSLVSKTKKITRCYTRNFGLKFKDDSKNDYSGRDLIVKCEHDFAKCGNYVTGDGKFDMGEEECWRTNPKSADTDGDGTPDEADIVGLNQGQFTWKYKKGDRVGVRIEGTSANAIEEGTAAHKEYKKKEESELREEEEACWDAYIERLKDGYPDTGPCYSEGHEPQVSGGSLDEGTGNIEFIDQEYSTETPNQKECRERAQREYRRCVAAIQEYEEEETEAKGEMTGYYKMTWATPDFCSKDAMEKGTRGEDGYTPNDSCDEKKQFGFPFYATIPVSEKGNKPLKVSINHSPKNPQLNIDNKNLTSLITAQATIANDDVEQDFVYYKWRIMRCAEGDFNKCSEGEGGINVTERVESKVPLEGIGVKKIEFYPTAGVFEGERSSKEVLQVSVLAKRHKNDPMTGIADTYITLTKNNLKVRVFEAKAEGGKWAKGKEICTESPSLTLCPVYPGQVLAVTAEPISEEFSDIESYAWKLNDQAILPPRFSRGSCEELFAGGGDVKFCNGNEDRTNFGKTVFFPVTQKEGDLITLSALAERTGTREKDQDDNLISERSLSVIYPQGKFDFDSDLIKQAVNSYGEPSQEIFEAPAGEKINAQLILAPDYLTPENDMVITWQKNGTIIKGSTNQQEVAIQMPEGVGSIVKLNLRTEKVFSEEHFKLLAATWSVFKQNSLIRDTKLKIKTTEGVNQDETTSISQFFASTWYNAPHYLVFIIRLALLFVLIWGIFFGLAYSIRLI